MELFAADGHDAGGCERVTGKSGMRPTATAVCCAAVPGATLRSNPRPGARVGDYAAMGSTAAVFACRGRFTDATLPVAGCPATARPSGPGCQAAAKMGRSTVAPNDGPGRRRVEPDPPRRPFPRRPPVVVESHRPALARARRFRRCPSRRSPARRVGCGTGIKRWRPFPRC